MKKILYTPQNPYAWEGKINRINGSVKDRRKRKGIGEDE